MDFEHAAIALLASMVFVLAGMVGWLYWQQTRMTQNMNNIIMVVGELASARVLPEPAPVEEESSGKEEPPAEPEAEDEDDRVSVDKPEPVVIEGPPAPATEDNEELDGKTKKELQEILTKRGIPFGKSDNKGALLSLLKATS